MITSGVIQAWELAAGKQDGHWYSSTEWMHLGEFMSGVTWVQWFRRALWAALEWGEHGIVSLGTNTHHWYQHEVCCNMKYVLVNESSDHTAH